MQILNNGLFIITEIQQIMRKEFLGLFKVDSNETCEEKEGVLLYECIEDEATMNLVKLFVVGFLGKVTSIIALYLFFALFMRHIIDFKNWR